MTGPETLDIARDAIFISLLVALPFMAEKLHGQMLRIASHIITG